MSAKKILVIDDEQSIREMVRMALELNDMQCLEAGSASQALPLIIDQRPDMILLDWMMPEVSGLDFLRRLKRDSSTAEIPVIMLTAKTAEDSAVSGLDAGADDYISKPFRPRELVSRINALFRRGGPAGDGHCLQVQGLQLDANAHSVSIDGELVDIPPTEFKLLQFFMSHPERAYSRAQLLDHVWGGNVYIEERTVDVHIRRLRRSLRPGFAQRDYGAFIQTIRGTGYRFSAQLAAG
ncbi:MAG: phosphate regulon transcriptional regulator PhoB [Gammaproteobacteria bacterium]|nr:phosphate regulon transcriptional regulator PhoB [Gammaproteobacteria bacterium]NND39792.1 phosphate regulon transcriptional regulator PhoB [Pseudomonadales bacterium]NNL10462.1 phosphate regulon transcriptional regulator PhoB [Pseudomonadales bacterium]NNM10839.1 phosphate regulon transcriptional regulator PhoB [Pseudomonadales bacterium]